MEVWDMNGLVDGWIYIDGFLIGRRVMAILVKG